MCSNSWETDRFYKNVFTSSVQQYYLYLYLQFVFLILRKANLEMLEEEGLRGARETSDQLDQLDLVDLQDEKGYQDTQAYLGFQGNLYVQHARFLD